MVETLHKIYLYTRFERFWHWLQVVLVAVLLLTGFEIHGAYALFGFEEAVKIHNFCGQAWLVLFVFILFWLATTGQWKQYIPTTKKLFAVIRYYASGIFKGEPHPVPKCVEAKHNPLQRLTYLGITAVLLPLQMVTGLLYWLYNDWAVWGLSLLGLSFIALLHTLLAFAILIFVVVHVYMTSTGHTITAHLAAMFSGWEEVDETCEVQEWERRGDRTPTA